MNPNVKDLTGRTFGRLTVLKRDGSIRSHSAWACSCSCGSEARVLGVNLTSGKTRSCGCIVNENCKAMGERNTWSEGKVVTPIKPGDVFGRLTVVERGTTPAGNGRAAFWLCVCECGGHKTTRGDSLLQGRTKSCGCINPRLAAQSQKAVSARSKSAGSEQPQQARTKHNPEANTNMSTSNTTVSNTIEVKRGELMRLRDDYAPYIAKSLDIAPPTQAVLDWIDRALATPSSYANEKDKPRNALQSLAEFDPEHPLLPFKTKTLADVGEEAARQEQDRTALRFADPQTVKGETMSEQTNRMAGNGTPRKHSHYFKPCPYDAVDVYRVLAMFSVTDPCHQHALKKILCVGARGVKSAAKDIQEAIDTLTRWQEMQREDANNACLTSSRNIAREEGRA